MSGLNVDPTQNEQDMELLDSGAIGTKVKQDEARDTRNEMAAMVEQYGEKYVDKAIDRGWVPGDGDVKAFIKKNGATGKADPAVMAELKALKDRVARVDAWDREATEDHYDKELAKAKTPKEIKRINAERAKALAQFDNPGATAAKPAAMDVDPA
ncbi:MAG: hypothetical protein VXW22_16255, partial [Pseudomonadota bacterium]|nr:hypothetical protein [Pseudomonadota bacterium]